jgi:hypothetical protein
VLCCFRQPWQGSCPCPCPCCVSKAATTADQFTLLICQCSLGTCLFQRWLDTENSSQCFVDMFSCKSTSRQSRAMSAMPDCWPACLACLPACLPACMLCPPLLTSTVSRNQHVCDISWRTDKKVYEILNLILSPFSPSVGSDAQSAGQGGKPHGQEHWPVLGAPLQVKRIR